MSDRMANVTICVNIPVEDLGRLFGGVPAELVSTIDSNPVQDGEVAEPKPERKTRRRTEQKETEEVIVDAETMSDDTITKEQRREFQKAVKAKIDQLSVGDEEEDEESAQSVALQVTEILTKYKAEHITKLKAKYFDRVIKAVNAIA